MPEKKKRNRVISVRTIVPTLNEQINEANYLFRPLALRAMFMRPCYLETSAWLEHIPFAFWLIAAQRPRTVVELGTHYGTSYFAFCQAVQHLALDTQCYAVDHWKGDEHSGLYGEEVFEKVRTYNDAHFSTFSRLVRSTFDTAVTHFSDKSIDLLHIDGFHRLEAVQHDFETWLPKLSDQALVLLHDSNVRERNFGIFKFVEHLRQSYPLFEFMHGHGLSVVAAGAEQSGLVKRLLDSREDTHFRHVVHDVFGRLGMACADAFAARQHQARARELQGAVNKHRKEIEDLKGNLEEARAGLNAASGKLRNALLDIEKQGEQHASERSHLSARIGLLQELRSDQKTEIARLSQRIEETSADLKERTEALSSLQLSIEQNQRVLAKTQQEAEVLREALDTSRDELEQRNEELERTKLELVTQVQAKEAVLIAAKRAAAEALEARAQEVARLQHEVEARGAETEKLKAEKTAQTQKASTEKLALEQRLKQRSGEIAVLTRLVLEKQGQTDRLQRASNEFRRAMTVLLDISDRPGLPLLRRLGFWRRAKVRRKAALLKRSDVLDADWYRNRYEDVAHAGVDPLLHYVEYGAREGREPNALVAQARGEM